MNAEPNPTELFLHIIGVIGAFVGIGTLLFGTIALRRAKRIEQVRAIVAPLVAGRRVGLEHISGIDVILVISVLLIAITGLDMARTTNVIRSGWVDVAIATFLVLGPIAPLVIEPRLRRIAKLADTLTDGPLSEALRASIHDHLMTAALRTLMTVLVAIVFLMTNKPSPIGSVIVVVIALVAGLAWSLASQASSWARTWIRT